MVIEVSLQNPGVLLLGIVVDILLYIAGSGWVGSECLFMVEVDQAIQVDPVSSGRLGSPRFPGRKEGGGVAGGTPEDRGDFPE